MKYIIIKNQGVEVPIMFPDIVQHNTFADMNPISAGKFGIGNFDIGTFNVDWKVYGESTSLKLQSRPEDADIIKHAFDFAE